jgi:hypothetical protein
LPRYCAIGLARYLSGLDQLGFSRKRGRRANQGRRAGHRIFSLEVMAEWWPQPNDRGKQEDKAVADREDQIFN